MHVDSTTDELFRFRNKKIDEMRCKLDSTENLRLIEKYPTPP